MIEHLVSCDACGGSAPLDHLEEDDPLTEAWAPPVEWIAIVVRERSAVMHFCSWLCAGAYVTQRIREDEIAAHSGGQ